MKLRAGPIAAWVALTGVLCAQLANAAPLSLKLSRDIDVPVVEAPWQQFQLANERKSGYLDRKSEV